MNLKKDEKKNPTLDGVNEFRIGKGWGILLFCCFLFFIGIYLWIVLFGFAGKSVDWSGYVFAFIPFGGIAILFLIGVIWVFKTKYIVSDLGIAIYGLFRSSEISWSEIKNIMFFQNYSVKTKSIISTEIRIITVNDKLIKIAYTYMNNANRFVKILKTKIPEEKWI
jgi:hypothetical protein